MPKQSQYRLTGQIPEIDVRQWKRNGYALPDHHRLDRLSPWWPPALVYLPKLRMRAALRHPLRRSNISMPKMFRLALSEPEGAPL